MSPFFVSMYCLTFNDALTLKAFFLTSLVYPGNLWSNNKMHLTQVLSSRKLESAGDVIY